jgi:hypothetical protein
MTIETAPKLDLTKEHPQFFRAPRRPELVDLPGASYLAVDGAGEAGGAVFQQAIGGLYGVAYGIKMEMKRRGLDFKVVTFGASWWIEDAGQELPPEQWRWQLTMMVPDFVTEADVARAEAALALKKKAPEPPVRLQRMTQGLCVQQMHVGPYAAEQATIDEMEAFMAAHRLRRRGVHHEVYLSDPTRSRPEAIKTLLRIPVEVIE